MMKDEATPTGAEETNSPAHNSIDHAVESMKGLFEKEEPEESEEPEGSEDKPVASDGDEPEEASDEGETEEPEESDEGEAAKPLTTLSQLAEKLGVDESTLYDIKLPTKIDGEDGEATLAQLVKSHQLEGHLNRKSMEVSDLKKEVEKQRELVAQEHQRKMVELAQASKVAQQLLYGEWQQVNWDQLRREDPQEYLFKKTQFEEYQQSLGQVNALFQQEQAKYAREQEALKQKYIADQQKKLLSAIPEWNNKETLKKEYSAVVSFLRDEPDLKLSDDEIKTLTDHRIYLIARDAKRYRDLKKSNPKVENKANKPGPTVKSGGNPQRDVLKAKELRKQMGKRHDVNSAAALMEQLARKR